MEKHANYLSCPKCNHSLKLKIFSKFSDNLHVKDGILNCVCGYQYPIINGIPRLLVGALRNLIKKNHPGFFVKYSEHLRPISIVNQDKIQEKTALVHDSYIEPHPEFKKHVSGTELWLHPLKRDYFKNKVVLDAGCRIGTHMYHISSFKPKLVIGIDIGESVETAFKINQKNHNVLVIQADLYTIPTSRIFDICYCFGVLHHLPNPEKGFQTLIEKIKLNGKLLFWVYGHDNYIDRQTIVFLRKLTLNLDMRMVRIISMIYASIYFLRIKLHNLQPKNQKKENSWFRYLDKFPFFAILQYIYDQFSPPISHYYKKNDLEEWFECLSLKKIDMRNFQQGWKVLVDITN